MTESLVVFGVIEDSVEKLRKFPFLKEMNNAAIIKKIDRDKCPLVLDEDLEGTSLDKFKDEQPE